jgi:hypothetical protein
MYVCMYVCMYQCYSSSDPKEGSTTSSSSKKLRISCKITEYDKYFLYVCMYESMYVCMYVTRREVGLSACGKVPFGPQQLSSSAIGIVVLPTPIYELVEVYIYICMYV